MGKPERRQPIIAVCGAGRCDTTLDALAEEVGRRIADANALLICGGLGGVMAAACRGASAAGGTTIGILPGSDTLAANPDVRIPTYINRTVIGLSALYQRHISVLNYNRYW
jgi:uncharacterized protein (TIGR00725 family)